MMGAGRLLLLLSGLDLHHPAVVGFIVAHKASPALPTVSAFFTPEYLRAIEPW